MYCDQILSLSMLTPFALVTLPTSDVCYRPGDPGCFDVE